MTSNPALIDGNNFGPSIPHCGPDDVACELRSCPRPAEVVLLLRGAYRTRCVLHAAELRRQGATLTELEPGFDRTPVTEPAEPPTLATEDPMPTPCRWPDCPRPRNKRLFCHTCQGRAYSLTGSANVPEAQIVDLPRLWAEHVAADAARRRAPKTAAVAPLDISHCADTVPMLPDQPAPAPALGDVWTELILACEHSPWHAALVPLMQERRALGIARYGVSLQRANGRDHIVDASQELLDAAVYCWAAEAHGVARESLDALLRLRMLPVESDERNREQVSQRGVLSRQLEAAQAELAEARAAAAEDLDLAARSWAAVAKERDDLKDELATARKHIEELAYAAGSLHKANAAGYARGVEEAAVHRRLQDEEIIQLRAQLDKANAQIVYDLRPPITEMDPRSLKAIGTALEGLESSLIEPRGSYGALLGVVRDLLGLSDV